MYKDGALTYGVLPGKWFNGDAVVTYAGSTGNALTDDATNYIYLTASGTLTINTTGFPLPSNTQHIRLAAITTASGAYDADTAVVDWRAVNIYSIGNSPLTAQNVVCVDNEVVCVNNEVVYI